LHRTKRGRGTIRGGVTQHLSKREERGEAPSERVRCVAKRGEKKGNDQMSSEGAKSMVSGERWVIGKSGTAPEKKRSSTKGSHIR